MRKIHSTLRLFFEAGLSIRAIARTLRVSPAVPAKGGMGDAIRRAEVAGLSWPSPEGLDERALEARLFPGAGVPAPARRAMPQWVHTSRRVAAQGGHHPVAAVSGGQGRASRGASYSQFCERYRALRQGVDGVMRHNPPRRREAVCRLRRAHGAHRGTERAARGAGVRRGGSGASSYIPAYAGTTWAQTAPWSQGGARCVQPPQIRPDHLVGPRIAVELQQ